MKNSIVTVVEKETDVSLLFLKYRTPDTILQYVSHSVIGENLIFEGSDGWLFAIGCSNTLLKVFCYINSEEKLFIVSGNEKEKVDSIIITKIPKSLFNKITEEISQIANDYY